MEIKMKMFPKWGGLNRGVAEREKSSFSESFGVINKDWCVFDHIQHKFASFSKFMLFFYDKKYMDL